MKDSLKILLVMPFFYPHRGGSQKYAEELYTKIIQNHPNVQADVLAYNTDKTKTFEIYKNMNIYRVPCINIISARFTLPNPVMLYKQLNILKANRYDIINTHIRFFDPTWWVWKYARSVRAKSFFTGHVATHPVHQNKIVELIAKIIDSTIARYSLNKYDLISYVSNTTKEFFEKTLKVKRKGEIIYGSVDTSFFHTEKDAKERTIPKVNIKISKDITLITYVGRLIWTKGITYFYDAIKEISKDPLFKNCVFVMAGPGELEDQIINSIKLDGLDSKIILTGNLDYTEVRDLLAISDIYINPSHHSEGFPLAILEAGASGCFVIATDNAGTKEVIQNKKTGILIKQKNTQDIIDSLKWSLEEKDKRTKMAHSLQTLIKEKFDIEKTSEDLYKFLHEAVKG